MGEGVRRHHLSPSFAIRGAVIEAVLARSILYWQGRRVSARLTEAGRMVAGQGGWRVRLEPWLRHVFHVYWRFARGMTLGVRGVVLDAENRVLLVKHSYISGWHLPGGGVEVGESFGEALTRELLEEGRIALAGEPELHGIFLNSHVSRRDHVAVYVVRAFTQDHPPEPNREIIATGFFAADALPEDTTLGTRLRIAEVLRGVKPIPTWRSP
jgi:8-oxo-dGTP pyrophosphatase MutT (NUDIX family)